MQWQRLEDFVATDMDGSHVMFSIASGTYAALNDSAKLIWEALAAPMHEKALTALLVARYEVDDATAAAAVSRTISTLAEQKLIGTVAA